jgi:outer membrane murein-binding lipoprotein Lpp
MSKLANRFWVGLVFGTAIALSGCDTVKDYDELSTVQISALQESNARLDTFDQRLQELDSKLAQRKIHAAEYKRRADELTSLIAEESQFQNAILLKDPKIKIMARHLLDNIQKAIEATPAIAAAITLGALRGLAGATITP